MSGSENTTLVAQARSELAPGALRYFETHLADEPTIRDSIDLIVRIAERCALSQDHVLVLAVQGAMLHRIPALCEPSPDRSPTDLIKTVPFPIDLELERVLLGHRSHDAMVRHCIAHEERAAAAMLALVTAWSTGEPAPVWSWEPLRATLGLAESDLAELERELGRSRADYST